MPIKNYTSKVPAGRSIASIEAMLIRVGATAIYKETPAGRVDALCFRLKTKDGALDVRLPARVDRVYAALTAGARRRTAAAEKSRKEQAERTAWRLLDDWVRVQWSLIELGQVEPAEVFLAYVLVGPAKTMYDVFKDEQVKKLPPA